MPGFFIFAQNYNMSKPQASLLILAAGMGSRYGGLKQMDAFGPNGETIIDYSIYDALQAGFKKFVFVIRKSFENEFKSRMDAAWGEQAELHYICQELDLLPEGFCCPEGRTKPWGTGHAVWVAHDVLNEPFGVINADDYYGREALISLYQFLIQNPNPDFYYAVIAYFLNNTLSDHGAVNRGICWNDHEGFLKKVVETKGIQKSPSGEIYAGKEEELQYFPPETLVSMNMWGFGASYFQFASERLTKFLQSNLIVPDAEFYIPELIQNLIDEGRIKVQVLSSPSSWFGVTYQEDKPFVRQAFKKMIEEGYYPDKLKS